MYKFGGTMQQNPIRFKNLLYEAVNQLVSQNIKEDKAKDLLSAGFQLLDNESFWLHPADGLAVFISTGIFKPFRLSTNLPEFTYVGPRFYIRPIFHLLSGMTRFYILDIDLSQLHLYEATQYSITEISSERLPQGIEKTLNFDTSEKQNQFASKPRASENSITVFGYGRHTDKDKVYITQYYYIVNESVREILKNSNAPLIIGGEPHLQAHYRSINTYPFLLEQGIPKGLESFSTDKIHESAWEIINKRFTQQEIKALEKFNEMIGKKSSRISSKLETIVEGARHGRIDTLFVNDGIRHAWGLFDESKQDIKLHKTPKPGDEDLLDKATIDTLLRGGTIYILHKDEKEFPFPMAAILRY